MHDGINQRFAQSLRWDLIVVDASQMIGAHHPRKVDIRQQKFHGILQLRKQITRQFFTVDKYIRVITLEPRALYAHRLPGTHQNGGGIG